MDLRELRSDDLESVAQLFLQTFRPSEAASDGARLQRLIAYLSDIFLAHRFSDAATPSWVCHEGGALIGFIGVLPMRMVLGERQVLAAVCTTLMVRDPEKNPMAGAQLMRRVLRGSQDLTLGDTAIHGAQAMWVKLGGFALPLQSLGWTRLLRPAAYVLDRVGLRVAGLAKLAEPVSRAILGRASGGPPEPPDSAVTSSDVDVATYAAMLPELERHLELRPDWTGDSLTWLLNQAGRRDSEGPLHRRIVRAGNRPVGAYLYYGRPGRTGNVLQIDALPRFYDATVQDLFRHAYAGGMAAVKGGAHPPLMPELFRAGCFFRFRGATVYHSRDAGVIEAIRGDKALLGGLAGERWTKLDGDTF